MSSSSDISQTPPHSNPFSSSQENKESPVTRGRSSTTSRRASVSTKESSALKDLKIEFYTPDAGGKLKEIDTKRLPPSQVDHYVQSLLGGKKDETHPTFDRALKDLYSKIFEKYEDDGGHLRERETGHEVHFTTDELMKTTATALLSLSDSRKINSQVILNGKGKKHELTNIGVVKTQEGGIDVYIIRPKGSQNHTAQFMGKTELSEDSHVKEKLEGIKGFCSQLFAYANKEALKQDSKSGSISELERDFASSSIMNDTLTVFKNLKPGESKYLDFTAYGMAPKILATRTENGEFIASLMQNKLAEGSFSTIYNAALKSSFAADPLFKSYVFIKTKPDALKSAQNAEQFHQANKILKIIGGKEGIQPAPLAVVNITGKAPSLGRLEFKLDGDARVLSSPALKERVHNQEGALGLIRHAISGLETMHSYKIIHGDIKPENMLVKLTQGEIQLKFCDFGGAVIVDETSVRYDSLKKEYKWDEPLFTLEYVTFEDSMKLNDIIIDLAKRREQISNGSPLEGDEGKSIQDIDQEAIKQIRAVMEPADIRAFAISMFQIYKDQSLKSFDEGTESGIKALKDIVPGKVFDLLIQSLDEDYTKRPSIADFKAALNAQA